MASKTIPLAYIPQNWYMGWTISTQSASKICVTLKDSANTYIDNVCKKSTSFLPPLSTGFQQVTGTGLAITIDVPDSKDLDFVVEPYQVCNAAGSAVVQGVNILLEDASGSGYSDLFASIVAWQAVS